MGFSVQDEIDSPYGTKHTNLQCTIHAAFEIRKNASQTDPNKKYILSTTVHYYADPTKPPLWRRPCNIMLSEEAVSSVANGVYGAVYELVKLDLGYANTLDN